MTDVHPEDPTGTPITEVVVYRDGNEIHRQFAETAGEAAAIVAHWEEERGVECEVIDLSAPRDESATEVDWIGEDEPAVTDQG
jgi:hypothetical protein